jgi:uncharacterized protein with PQ loop repeat
MNETLANIAIVAATIGTVTFLLPQIIKLIRTRDSAGVSTTWAVLGFVTNVGWFTYMINQELWAGLIAPFATFISYAITIWALNRTGRDLRRGALLGLVWTMVLVGFAWALGWSALGVVLGLSYGVMLMPSVWTASKTIDPSGISPGTWWIGLAEAILWGYYGWFHADAGIVTFFVIGVIGSTLILDRYYSTRRLARAPA